MHHSPKNIGYHGMQPVVKDHSPMGKLNVENLY